MARCAGVLSSQDGMQACERKQDSEANRIAVAEQTHAGAPLPSSLHAFPARVISAPLPCPCPCPCPRAARSKTESRRPEQDISGLPTWHTHTHL